LTTVTPSRSAVCPRLECLEKPWQRGTTPGVELSRQHRQSELVLKVNNDVALRIESATSGQHGWRGWRRLSYGHTSCVRWGRRCRRRRGAPPGPVNGLRRRRFSRDLRFRQPDCEVDLAIKVVTDNGTRTDAPFGLPLRRCIQYPARTMTHCAGGEENYGSRRRLCRTLVEALPIRRGHGFGRFAGCSEQHHQNN